MAKKTTAKQNTNNGESKFKGIRNFFTSERTRFITGLVISIVTIYVGLALISFFFTGGGGSEQDREYPVVGPGDQSWISRELDGGARGFSCRFADEPVVWDFFFPDPVFPRFSRGEANEPEPGIVVETFPVQCGHADMGIVVLCFYLYPRI